MLVVGSPTQTRAGGAQTRHPGEMMASRIASNAERVIYRIAGLPVAVAALLGVGGAGEDPLQSTFAWRYWHPESAAEWSELVAGLVTWPVAVLMGSLWFTLRNGRIVSRRHGKSVPAQWGEQLRLYFS